MGEFGSYFRRIMFVSCSVKGLLEFLRNGREILFHFSALIVEFFLIFVEQNVKKAKHADN